MGMFVAVLFIIQTLILFNSQRTDNINVHQSAECYNYSIEYYKAIKMNELLLQGIN